jgi:hypothetical protein
MFVSIKMPNNRVLPAMVSTRQAAGPTAAEPPALHVRRPNLGLDDLLRFVIKPL